MLVLTPVRMFLKAVHVFKAISDTKVKVPQCSRHQRIVDCVKCIQDTDRKTTPTGPPQNLIKAEIA